MPSAHHRTAERRARSTFAITPIRSRDSARLDGIRPYEVDNWVSSASVPVCPMLDAVRCHIGAVQRDAYSRRREHRRAYQYN